MLVFGWPCHLFCSTVTTGTYCVIPKPSHFLQVGTHFVRITHILASVLTMAPCSSEYSIKQRQKRQKRKDITQSMVRQIASQFPFKDLKIMSVASLVPRTPVPPKWSYMWPIGPYFGEVILGTGVNYRPNVKCGTLSPRGLLRPLKTTSTLLVSCV